MMVKAVMSDQLIGTAPAALKQREGVNASFAVGSPAARCVSAQSHASNAWNQNWNSSNPGNQNNNNKTNTNRARAVRRPKLAGMDDLPTAEEIFCAYYECRKTKRNTWNAIKFEERLERNLMQLLHELRNGEYQIGTSECFVVTHPKVREVWAADFRDRVVHHLLYRRISPHFHARFISDTYACIPERGTHKAVDRVEKMLRSASQDRKDAVWYLKCDIANFFVSIDKGVLDDALAAELGDETWTMRLARQILHHNPVDDVRIKSPTCLMRAVPPQKSLFNAGGNGLPIGNLSSQFFANVYLNALDQHVKRQPWGRHYVRYVDDMVIVSRDVADLWPAAQTIDWFLVSNLGCALHPRKTQIMPAAQGLPFLGFVLRPWSRYIKRETERNARRSLQGKCRARQRPKTIQATANSFFGIFRQANGWRARERLAAILRSHGHLISPKLNRMFA